jgi:hypothetical protein
MPSASRTIVVDRAPDVVFTFFTTPDNDRRWRSHVKAIAAEGPLAEGVLVHQEVHGPGGRTIPASMRVTKWSPAQRYGFEVVEGPARPVGEFRFRPVPAGTEVTFSLSAELHGWWRRLLLSGPVQRSMESEMRALDSAKAEIERRHSAAAS